MSDKLFKRLGLIFVLLFLSLRGHAVAPAVAIPVGLGALEVLAVGAGAAYAAGIISAQQNAEFNERISGISKQIMEAAQQNVEALKSQASALYNSMIKAKKHTKSERATKIEAEKDADCPQGQNENSRDCCEDWIKEKELSDLDANKQFIWSAGYNTYRVYRGNTLLCCLEWDSTHARFEVYKYGGNGKYLDKEGDPYNHMGEFSCKKATDSSQDPCSDITYPLKADNSGKHAPRAGCEYNPTIDHQSVRPGYPKPATR